jgi:hypothetical protein
MLNTFRASKISDTFHDRTEHHAPPAAPTHLQPDHFWPRSPVMVRDAREDERVLLG